MTFLATAKGDGARLMRSLCSRTIGAPHPKHANWRDNRTVLTAALAPCSCDETLSTPIPLGMSVPLPFNPADDTQPRMPDLEPVGADPFGEQLVEEETRVPRGGPVSGGKRASIPPAPALPTWRDPSLQDRGDAVEQEPDYTDLEAVNRDLQHLRVRLSQVRRSQRAAARAAVEAKLTYQRALRRALVSQSGGTAESRKAYAELQCEELEADYVLAQQVADEYNTLFRSVRDDVDNAKTVAYNLRTLSGL